MNNQTPGTEALNEHERELARIVRALPGGEPSSELDARILKAAGNAAASSRRPRARWVASAGAIWGIGAAAAAVLALGVSWQLMVPAHRSMQPESAPAASIEDHVGDSTGSVEFKDQRPAESGNVTASAAESAPATAAESESASAAATALTRATAGTRAQAAPAPSPPPPPAAPMPTAAMPTPFAAEPMNEPVTSSAQAAPAAKAMAETGMSQRAAAKSELSAQAAASDAATAGMANGTSEAGPMQAGDWLVHIRQLRDQDRAAEARASLLEFRKRYPDFVIPPDLAPLLRE